MAVIRSNMKKGGGKGASWGHGGRKGGGKGAGGGQWLFVPSFSTGKGIGKKTGKSNKFMDKLGKIDADHKVWVGGLSKAVTWKKLEKHFEESGGVKPQVTEIMNKGTACCAFKDADEAQSAIASMNGSELEGKSIEVDVWTAKEKTPREDRPNKKSGAKSAKTSKQHGNFDRTVDASLKVWVGGLAEKTSPAKLMKHFADNSCQADGAGMMKTGTACVTFKAADEASSAVSTMNGTEVDGKAIEVDVWTKLEKKDKEAKKAKKE